MSLQLPLDHTDGERAVHVLTLPFLPPSKNQYANWPPAWKAGTKGKWRRWIRRLCDEQQVPRGQWRMGLAAKLVFPTANRRDPQNYAHFLWHVVPDVLQADGRGHLRDAGWDPVLMDDRDGAIDFGSNLGIMFEVDRRNHLPKKDRQRTILAMAFQLQAGEVDSADDS